MRSQLSRRAFLRSAGLFGSGLLWNPHFCYQDPPTPEGEAAPAPVDHWDGSPLGRVLLDWMTVYAEPSWRAVSVGGLSYDTIVGVHNAIPGEGLYHTNNTWLEVDGGYIYSSWVQPINNIPTNPALEIGEGGAWGTVTVPSAEVRNTPDPEAPVWTRMPYSTVHRVMGLENGLYRIDESYGFNYYMKPGDVRIIAPEEVSPLSPQVPPELKRIEVSIRDQRLRAFEGEQEVYSVPVSTGMPGTPTPVSDFTVLRKRPGHRMAGGLGPGAYNLPGIPYVCYINSNWVALHGCYWHNDYGRMHSNGCINMHPMTAQWVFRWTTPYPNYYAFETVPNAEEGQPGTLVRVTV
ncbi:MAG: L,D-transpeptidase [Chloroflexota bacterium]